MKADRLASAPSPKKTRTQRQLHLGRPQPNGIACADELIGPLRCRPGQVTQHNLRLSQSSGRTQGTGWFPGGARLGHFPKRGSTLRPHPGEPKAPLVHGFWPSGQA